MPAEDITRNSTFEQAFHILSPELSIEGSIFWSAPVTRPLISIHSFEVSVSGIFNIKPYFTSGAESLTRSQRCGTKSCGRELRAGVNIFFTLRCCCIYRVYPQMRRLHKILSPVEGAPASTTRTTECVTTRLTLSGVKRVYGDFCDYA